ncbi:hypothetical protein X740_15790 [Mesorhizobium sp. LNHC221B00]|nr:hypothetical protein X740_15790 [Mesorhizobium sp. LNHC221B00]
MEELEISAGVISLMGRLASGPARSSRSHLVLVMVAVMGSVFRLAIVTLRAEADPTLHLRGAPQPPKVNGRAAITDEKKFGKLVGQPSYSSTVIRKPVAIGKTIRLVFGLSVLAGEVGERHG